MQFETQSNWTDLLHRLDQLDSVDTLGQAIVDRAAERFYRQLHHHLADQGRGGAPPPLSAATHWIYQQRGNPDGSGIRNHLRLEPGQWVDAGRRYRAQVGVLEGRPTMVLLVQDEGCTIQVTPKMRMFLAAQYGIFLKSTTLLIHIPGRRVWRDSWSHTLRETRRELQGLLDTVAE